MRICIVAEHASTQFGGEAILPLHYFRFLRARGIETWMVVHMRTRDELEKAFPHDIDRILFVSDSAIQRGIFRIGKYLPRRLMEATLGFLSNAITQFRQRKIVRALVRRERIDVLHQPIPVSPRFPSFLFGLGVPQIIGPLNGGMEYPSFFKYHGTRVGNLAVTMSRMFAEFANILFPGKPHADVILVANQRTRLALPSGIRGKIIEMSENGVDLALWSRPLASAASETPRFVFLGRLIDLKAVDVVIRALTFVPGVELEIIGDGEMAQTWKTLVTELALTERVHFLGWLPQAECALHVRSALALVLPSLHECGGAVVLEAMAMGKPVISTNWGGPADYLDSSCGILIDPTSYSALVDGFAEAMRTFSKSPEIASAMGLAGYDKVVKHFDWERKIDAMISLYGELSGQPDQAQELDQVEAAS
jgi:glycosyltransferase involved in cell wall biosynthesis